MWQRQGSALQEVVGDEAAEPVFVPSFLVQLEPRHRSFLRNLRDLVWPQRQPPLRLISWPAAPWPDVLLPSRFPWRGLSESLLLHVLVLATFWGIGQVWPYRPQLTARPVFTHQDVIYYSPSEYLPPLNTGQAAHSLPQKGEPEFARQPIISVPPEADNRNQTIVLPTDVKLDHDVPLPNIVAASPTRVMVPMAATERAAADLRLPSLPTQVIAPAPALNAATDRRAPDLQQQVVTPAPDVNLASTRQVQRAPEASVVAPPPSLETSSLRKVGDINIARAQAVAPAPQLPVSEQRSLARMPIAEQGSGATAVPPAPSTQGAGASGGGGAGRLIALNVRPLAPNTAAEMPAGNRRGTFAATPEGKAGAPGTPASAAGITQGAANGSNQQESGPDGGAGKTTNDAPSGLFVGAGPKETGASTGSAPSQSDKAALMASAKPPRVGPTPRASEVTPDRASDLDKRVFGGRRFYSMTLNMPNLNSASGNWVIRFAELQDNQEKGDLSAPVATQKVDPAYPLEMMRRNIQGTVTLRAIIRSDGTVGDVRIIDGVNDRLDQYAEAALLKWHFLPATKNGNAVDLEAIVRIPFKPFRSIF